MQITIQIFEFFKKQVIFFEIVFNSRSRNSSLSKCNFVHWSCGYSISWQRDMRCRRENEYRYDMSSESSRFPLHAVSSLPLRHLSPTPPHRCFLSFSITIALSLFRPLVLFCHYYRPSLLLGHLSYTAIFIG